MPDEGQDVTTMAEADAAVMEPDVASPPETPPDAAPETSPEGTDSADPGDRPRDAQGRFVEPEDAPEEAGPAAADGAPEASPPESPADPDATADSFPEYAFRANGQDVPIPGSQQREDGVFIPTDSLPQVARVLSDGTTFHQSLPRMQSQWQQRIADSDSRATAAEERANQWEAALEKVLTDEATRQTVLDDPDGFYKRLRVDADVAATKASESAAQAEVTRMRQDQQLRETEADRGQALTNDIVTLGRESGLTDTEIEVLGPDIWQALWSNDRLWRFASKDEAAASGGRATEGQLSMDAQLVRDEMSRVARSATILRARKQQVDAKASPAPAATPVAGPKNTVPPVASAQGAPTPAVKEPVTFANQAEADAWFQRTSADDMI